MHETEREAGIIPIPEKLLSKIHSCELEMTNGMNTYKAAQKRGADLVESYLENACGIDLAAEKWEIETEQRRFRRADVRPPELRPELEVKPSNGQPTSATDYLPVEEKVGESSHPIQSSRRSRPAPSPGGGGERREEVGRAAR